MGCVSWQQLVVMLEDVCALITAYVFCTVTIVLHNKLKSYSIVPDSVSDVVHQC